MGDRREIHSMRSAFLEWGEDLPGLSLNLFADELPAAYFRDGNRKAPEDFPVLRRCEKRAKIRRGCLASSVAIVRDFVAAEIGSFDYAVAEGRGSQHEWEWISEFPRAFATQYDRDFHRRVLALAIGLWDRMETGTFTEPCCTAEEILISIVLSDYKNRLTHIDLPLGYVDLDERWLEDDDYLLLYNVEIAERDDVLKALEPEIGTVNLDFGSWFKPLYGSLPVSGLASERVIRKINGTDTRKPESG